MMWVSIFEGKFILYDTKNISPFTTGIRIHIQTKCMTVVSVRMDIVVPGYVKYPLPIC